MADALKIQQGAIEENVTDVGREHSEKLQQLARSTISSLYMLIRSVKLYDPDNEIFVKPLEVLKDHINAIVAADSKYELQIVKQSFYMNNMLVKVDANSLDNQRALISELQARDVGGFTLVRSVQVQDLKNFIWIFAKEQTENPNDDGLAGRKLLDIKVAKWSKIKEKLDKADEQLEQKIDRKKYAMTVYARSIVFMSQYLHRLRGEKPIKALPAGRLIQDLVDICFDQKTHFLGMTTVRADDQYLVYHSVNCCLLSVVFGVELGLSKANLKDLGNIAMFHDVGLVHVPPELINKKGPLSAEEKRIVARAPLDAIKAILTERGLSRGNILRLVTTFEYPQDFGTAVRDSRGGIQMIIPKSNLGVYSKIIAIAHTYDALTSKRPYRDAYGPEIALTLMWTEMRHKFDPELLKVFMKVMAIQPVRVLKAGSTVNFG
jgi:HD-GYP domain-containing protein (c-di-GMP phosphodiesterase class II)